MIQPVSLVHCYLGTGAPYLHMKEVSIYRANLYLSSPGTFALANT